jgi:hypothetical protein
MTYACTAWELVAATYLLKLLVLSTVGNFPKCTLIHDSHMNFNLPYVYNYITKSCRQQAEVIQNHENEHVHGIGQGKARHTKYSRLNLGGGQSYDCSNDYAAIVA